MAGSGVDSPSREKVDLDAFGVMGYNSDMNIERNCQCCNNTFTARSADVKRGWALYCSKRCKAIKQEARTGQYAALGNRDTRTQHERDMDDTEQGWDAHKDAW